MMYDRDARAMKCFIPWENFSAFPKSLVSAPVLAYTQQRYYILFHKFLRNLT